MELIILRKGEPVKVLYDECDHEVVSKYRWSISNGYAVARINKRMVRMHRLFMGAKLGEIVDHKNHNRGDNRRENIRVCTHAENQKNRTTASQTGFLGVSFYKSYNLYQSRIKVNKTPKFLGYFKRAEDAARAYDKAARQYHGEFANLNFKD